MKHFPKPALAAAFAPRAGLVIVRDFLADRGDGLVHAACMLGGSAAGGRMVLLIEAVRTATQLTRAHCRQLVELHKLLTLEHVGDLDRIESSLFADIDPASPAVDEICLLAEALERVLHRIAGNASCDTRSAAEVQQHLRQVA